jgi:hypothetical protein
MLFYGDRLDIRLSTPRTAYWLVLPRQSKLIPADGTPEREP